MERDGPRKYRGGIDVPIYPTMTEADYKYILNHSESKFCFVSNKELLDKVNAVKDEVPKPQGVYTFEDVAVDSWKVLEAGGDDQQAELDSRRDAIKPEELVLLFTLPERQGFLKA